MAGLYPKVAKIRPSYSKKRPGWVCSAQNIHATVFFFNVRWEKKSSGLVSADPATKKVHASFFCGRGSMRPRRSRPQAAVTASSCSQRKTCQKLPQQGCRFSHLSRWQCRSGSLRQRRPVASRHVSVICIEGIKTRNKGDFLFYHRPSPCLPWGCLCRWIKKPRGRSDSLQSRWECLSSTLEKTLFLSHTHTHKAWSHVLIRGEILNYSN